MRFLVVLVLLLGTPSLVRADGEGQVWDALFMQYRPVKGGIAGWFDAHVRRGGSTVTILRPAIGWGLGKHLTLHVGYAYIHTFITAMDDAQEHRTWEQALYNRAFSDELKVQGRFRVEQRFIDGDDGTGHRLRMLGRVQYGPRADAPQIVLIDEVFVNLVETMRIAKGYNQNRAFFGLGADLKVKGLRLEGGYQNIHFDGGRMDHAIVLNLFALIQ
jgi:hypothetical protein